MRPQGAKPLATVPKNNAPHPLPPEQGTRRFLNPSQERVGILPLGPLRRLSRQHDKRKRISAAEMAGLAEGHGVARTGVRQGATYCLRGMSSPLLGTEQCQDDVRRLVTHRVQ